MTSTTDPRDVVLPRRQRAITDAIIRATRHSMHEHGLDVTVEEIAAAAAVGRRTVFRHFATRENLIEVALTDGFAEFFDSLPHYDGGDWRNWLAELARRVHQRTADAGRVVWHLRTRRLPPQLARTYDAHLTTLHQLFTTIADTLWTAAGGDGPAPDQLRRTVAAHLSPLFTQAVLLDAHGDPEFAADIATTAITATLHRLLRDA